MHPGRLQASGYSEGELRSSPLVVEWRRQPPVWDSWLSAVSQWDREAGCCPEKSLQSWTPRPYDTIGHIPNIKGVVRMDILGVWGGGVGSIAWLLPLSRSFQSSCDLSTELRSPTSHYMEMLYTNVNHRLTAASVFIGLETSEVALKLFLNITSLIFSCLVNQPPPV